MKVRPFSLFICSLVGTSVAWAAPFSFEEAWSILLQKNNSLIAQKANVEHYKHLQHARRNLNYPAISIGANYTRLDQDVTLSGEQILESTGQEIPYAIGAMLGSYGLNLGAITSTMSEKDMMTSSIRAIWPIFTGGRISAAQRAAEGKKEEAESQLEMETQARYEDLSKYYYGVVLAREVIATRIAVETGLTRHRDNAVKLEEQAQIAHVERLQAEASLDKASVDLNKAQKNLSIAVSALTQILNQSEKVDPNALLFINQELPPLESFIDKTLQTYPGLALLDAKEKQADSLVQAEKGKYYPEVYLFGNYNLYEDDSLTSQVLPDWMMGVGVNFSILENSGRKDQVRAALSTVSRVKYIKEQAKQDLRLLVEKTYLEAEQAIDEVNGLNSSVELAKENLKLRKKAFNQGLSTSVDVVDAELYLASVRTQQSVAGFNYLVSLSRLLALTNDMSSFGKYMQSAIPLNSLYPVTDK